MSNPGLSKFIKSPLTNIIEKKNPSQNESNCHPMILFLFLSKINQIGFSGKNKSHQSMEQKFKSHVRLTHFLGYATILISNNRQGNKPVILGWEREGDRS